MRKLLLLVFVAVMCVPSYGSILVYKTTQTATVFDLAGGTQGKETEKGFLVLDINLATQTINSAQQITYSGTTQRALEAAVLFHSDVTDYIVAEYSSGNTDAILFGKTSTTDIGLDGKETIAKSLKGYTLNFISPDLGSGTFTATLDSKTTKAKVDGTIDAVVTGLIEDLTKYEPVVDATPPVPSPMTFLLGGEPNAVSDTQIAMTATTATDAITPPVEYYFTNKTLTGHDSGWQSETTFTDSGLSSNTLYTYTVMARDSKAPVANVTTASADANATTHAVSDTTCPDPNPASFATLPTTLSDTSITMTATTEHDAQGVQYYFTNKTTTGHNSTWQASPTYTDIGLAPDTNYGYTVKARDNALVPNVTAESNQMHAVTGHDTTAPDPNPATFVIAPHATGATTIAMQATIATDASGPVYYQFYRASPPGSTLLFGWQTDSNFTDTGLTENTAYSYQVRSKDSATTVNTGAYSAVSATATTAKTIQGQIDAAKAARQLATPGLYGRVTVTIAAGTYAESIDICEPNITLVGAGAATTIIAPGANYQQAVEVNTNGTGAVIDGFTIKYGTKAYDGTHPSTGVIWVHANNSTIQNCVIDTNSDTIAGILIGDRVASVPNGGAGKIAIWGYNVATPSKGHTIQNNVFHSYIAGESVGIWAVKLSDDSLISGNTFNGDSNDWLAWSTTGNEGGPGTAIVIHSAAKGSGTHAVTVQNNTATYLKYAFLTFVANYFYNDSAGQKYEEPQDSDVNDVLVTGNTVSHIGTAHITGDGAGTGIAFVGARAGGDAYLGGSGDLSIGAGGVTITSNTFSANGYGVWIKVPKNYNSGASYGCVFDANHILVGTNNSLSGNALYGVYNGTHDATQETYHGSTVVDVNAAGNWWGAATGPYQATTNPFGGGDIVDVNVIYSPYRTTAP